MGSKTIANSNLCESGTWSSYSHAKSATPHKISVVLPAYNEEITIGSIVLLTRHYVDNVIVVDDGSADRTAEIAKGAGADVFIHKTNKGKGSALKTGFKAAADMGADIIVTMDSDGQHNPADIPNLLTPIIEEKVDMVIGSRYLNGLDKNTPSYRRVGQTVLDRVTNINSGLKVTDSQSGFRAFAASTIDIFRFKAQGMAIESEMLADAGKADLRIKEVDIGVRYDVDCSTISPLRHGFEVIINVLKDMNFNWPFFCFTIPGMSLGLIGIYIGTRFLQTISMDGGLHLFPTILTVLFVFFGGFMTLTGILLHTLPVMLRKDL